MASYTTNLNLKKPAQSDKIRIADFNGNADTIDAAIGSVGTAIISVGNTHAAISAGQYVYIRGHGTLSDGLYTAKSDLAANATLDSSKVTAVSGGGLNDLSGKVVHLTGEEVVSGTKIFDDGGIRMKNDGTSPRFHFTGGKNESSNAQIMAANAGNNTDSHYGQVRFMFYEYSPSADGSSRTSRYERYQLPEVDVARSSNATYDIITSKGGTYKPLYYKEVSGTTTANGNLNLSIPFASYAIVSAEVVSPDNAMAIPYRYSSSNLGVHISSVYSSMESLTNTSVTVKVMCVPVADIPEL